MTPVSKYLPQSHRLRLAILAAVAVSLFVPLVARLWYLQVIKETAFIERAADNTTETIIELAPRGRILDAEGRVLVDNRASIVVTIDKEEMATVGENDLGDLFFDLATEISRSGSLTKVSQIETAYKSNRYGPFAEVPVVQDISKELQIYLAEYSYRFPGVNTTVTTVRDYPYGTLAAHILGYVGLLSEDELSSVAGKSKTYLANDEIGKSGIELFYEDALRGTPGSKVVTVDKFNNILEINEETLAKAGSDVQLTINIDLQALAEQELERGLNLARQQPTKFEEEGVVIFNAPAGAMVVMDPRDGSILAMASHPTFDPELFVSGISQDDFDELTDPGNFLPLLNRTIQGQYPPGSTFKPFTAYAALDTGLIGSRGILGIDSMFYDEGIFIIPNCEGGTCQFQNAGEAAYGDVDLRLALTYSSDVYFYNLAASFDILPGFDLESVQVAANSFGYGVRTGVTLADEGSGRMPTPASRREAYRQNPEAFLTGQWLTGDTLNTSIGQGDVLATPLQIANAYSALVNGGTLYAPNLGQRVLNPITGDTEVEFAPRILRDIYFPEAFSEPILDGLAGVTTWRSDIGTEGTAYSAFKNFPHEQWPVSGKTGTSEKQVESGLIADYGLFVGWGPNPEPEYVAVVILEEAGFGGQVAAPVVRKYFERIANGTVPRYLNQDELDELARQKVKEDRLNRINGTEEPNEEGEGTP
ncbi:MAG: penicillin-binding protein 2 [Acidimicrobiales bacterium]|nr:penicillin-binding protein 2 [Acidimicrobiales bacterium]HJM27810.1 penicillin-binding protein 2 [Acidimicrobiales bacterium]